MEGDQNTNKRIMTDFRGCTEFPSRTNILGQTSDVLPPSPFLPLSLSLSLSLFFLSPSLLPATQTPSKVEGRDRHDDSQPLKIDVQLFLTISKTQAFFIPFFFIFFMSNLYIFIIFFSGSLRFHSFPLNCFFSSTLSICLCFNSISEEVMFY